MSFPTELSSSQILQVRFSSDVLKVCCVQGAAAKEEPAAVAENGAAAAVADAAGATELPVKVHILGLSLAGLLSFTDQVTGCLPRVCAAAVLSGGSGHTSPGIACCVH